MQSVIFGIASLNHPKNKNLAELFRWIKTIFQRKKSVFHFFLIVSFVVSFYSQWIFLFFLKKKSKGKREKKVFRLIKLWKRDRTVRRNDDKIIFKMPRHRNISQMWSHGEQTRIIVTIITTVAINLALFSKEIKT